MKRTLKDEIIRLTNIKASAKIRSVRRQTPPFSGVDLKTKTKKDLHSSHADGRSVCRALVAS